MLIALQRLQAGLRQGPVRGDDTQPPEPGLRALGAASRVGGGGDAEARTSATSTPSGPSTWTRIAGWQWLRTCTMRAASSIARASSTPTPRTTCRHRGMGQSFHDFTSGGYNMTGLVGAYNVGREVHRSAVGQRMERRRARWLRRALSGKLSMQRRSVLLAALAGAGSAAIRASEVLERPARYEPAGSSARSSPGSRVPGTCWWPWASAVTSWPRPMAAWAGRKRRCP